mgnify:CR=1 FL=1
MPELSKDLIALLSYLVPGFLVAWLFYALTSHQKPAQLERVIQALIFTLVVNCLVVLERGASLWIGHRISFGEWTKDSELVASIATAIAFGLLAVHIANTDVLHKWLRDRNLSKQSSHPTEWCTTFELNKSYVVLEMKDGRRLYGWPQIWPSNFEKGHLYITEASWIHGEEPVEMPINSGVLIPVNDVQHVEFINTTKSI